MLFHGIKSRWLAEKICIEDGVDPRLAGFNIGKLFGMGSYFTPNLSKWDGYTGGGFICNDTDAAGWEDERRVLLCRLNLGNFDVCKEPRNDHTIPPIFKFKDDDKEWSRLGWTKDNSSGFWERP